jgi:hypothetical protein
LTVDRYVILAQLRKSYCSLHKFLN